MLKQLPKSIYPPLSSYILALLNNLTATLLVFYTVARCEAMYKMWTYFIHILRIAMLNYLRIITLNKSWASTNSFHSGSVGCGVRVSFLCFSLCWLFFILGLLRKMNRDHYGFNIIIITLANEYWSLPPNWYPEIRTKGRHPSALKLTQVNPDCCLSRPDKVLASSQISK